MVKCFLIVFLIFSCQIAKTQDQRNYTEIKESQKKFTCSKNDLESVNITLKNLLELDTSKISIGLSDYFYDLGMAYYIKSEMYGESQFRPYSIKAFESCIKKDKKRGNAYHNLSVIYYLYQAYPKAKEYLKLYKKHTPKKYWDRELIEMVNKA
jgi:tetratricopeptide (TPR) repeat protein